MLKPCFVNTGFSTIAETGKSHTAKGFQQFFNNMWKTFSHFRHTADFWNFLLKFLHYFVHFVLEGDVFSHLIRDGLNGIKNCGMVFSAENIARAFKGQVCDVVYDVNRNLSRRDDLL